MENQDDNYDAWEEIEEQDDWGQIDEDDLEIEQIPTLVQKSSSLQSQDSMDLVNFKVLSYDRILKYMPKKIQKANNLLCLDDDDKIIAILRYFNWDQEKLEQEWFENQDKLQYEIGLEFDQEIEKFYPDVNQSRADQNEGCCSICYTEFDDTDPEYKAEALICGHQFHAVCWEDYLKQSVSDPQCVFLKCQQSNCNVVIPYSFFKRNLPKEENKDDGVNYGQKYLQWHIKQFTDKSRFFQWCPKKGCEDKIIYRSDNATDHTAHCSCGHGFCFKCLEEDHAPASCKQVKEWVEKEASESETLLYLKAFTKACPKCKKVIEKNQGCNHMTCSICKHQFCWLCLADDQGYKHTNGGYSQKCDKEPNASYKNLKQIQENAAKILERYQFNFERYNNEKNNRIICAKYLKKIQPLVKVLHTVKNYPESELCFLKESGEIISQARQVLKWTWVVNQFGQQKFMEDGSYELFKFQQDSLASICEKTQEKLEVDLKQFCEDDQVDRTPFFKHRSELKNLTQLLENQYRTFVQEITMDDKYRSFD